MIYISDLDGTLLKPDRSLGRYSRSVLERFIAAGGLFTIATGRGAGSTAALLNGLPLPLDAIVNNGALTLDLASGAPSHVQSLPGEVAVEVFKTSLAAGLTPMAYALDGRDRGMLLHGPHPNRVSQRYLDSVSRHQPTTQDRHGNALARPGVRCLSFILLDRPGLLTTLFRGIRQMPGVTTHLGRSVYAKGTAVGEVQDIAATKASAARRLCGVLGVSTDDIVAFGDNVNDLSLLDLAGSAYCPADSTPEVLAAAGGRVLTCAEEGVAHYMEDLPGLEA